jgi:hypothetical protein
MAARKRRLSNVVNKKAAAFRLAKSRKSGGRPNVSAPKFIASIDPIVS